jgi:hypothetical protein
MNNEPMVIAQGRKWLMPRSAQFGLAVAHSRRSSPAGLRGGSRTMNIAGLDDLQRRAELLGTAADRRPSLPWGRARDGHARADCRPT